MQLANIVHSAMGLFLIAIALGHIYLGSVGTEGVLDAMVSGEVDEGFAWLELAAREEAPTLLWLAPSPPPRRWRDTSERRSSASSSIRGRRTRFTSHSSVNEPC